MQFL
jgi:5-methylthioribose kinase